MIDTMIYHISLPRLRMYLISCTSVIVMMLAPFLMDSDSVYCLFPFTSVCTWLIQGKAALSHGIVLVSLYMALAMIMTSQCHRYGVIFVLLFPLMVETMLAISMDRMINIDEIMVWTMGVMVVIIYRFLKGAY